MQAITAVRLKNIFENERWESYVIYAPRQWILLLFKHLISLIEIHLPHMEGSTDKKAFLCGYF